MLGNRDSWPFKEPVDPKLVPLYYTVIQSPMDLSIIQSKIETGSYNNLRELELDFKLMVNNCETFNGPKNGYTSMVHAVWKVFRRAVKRYMNQDVSEHEQTVFMYPPKVAHVAPMAAIEARKRKASKRSKRGMRALEVLEKAAEIAVKDYSSRSSSMTGSSPSRSSVDQNEFFIFDELEKNRSIQSGPLDASSLIKYLYNAANDANLTGFYVEANDNLTFKSLTEWSESIRSSGNSIVLPHEAVVITDSSPVHDLCTSREENGNGNFVTLQVLPHSKPSDDDYTPKETDDSRRLVIKLSRCSNSGKNWKPVRILSDCIEEQEDHNHVGESHMIQVSNGMNRNEYNASDNLLINVTQDVNGNREEGVNERMSNIQIESREDLSNVEKGETL